MTRPNPGAEQRAIPQGGDAAVARSFANLHQRNPWTGRCRGCRQRHPCHVRQDADSALADRVSVHAPSHSAGRPVSGLVLASVNDADLDNARRVLSRHTGPGGDDAVCGACGQHVPCTLVRVASRLLASRSDRPWSPRRGTAGRAAASSEEGDTQPPLAAPLPVPPGGWVSSQVGSAGVGDGETSPVPASLCEGGSR